MARIPGTTGTKRRRITWNIDGEALVENLEAGAYVFRLTERPPGEAEPDVIVMVAPGVSDSDIASSLRLVAAQVEEQALGLL